MVPFRGERRHRISSSELPHVTEAIENQLREQLQIRTDPLQAEQLFRLWYRIQIHREGRPDYPDPITWSVIESYLSNTPRMVPLVLVAEQPDGEVV